jgi:hypothetical protein
MISVLIIEACANVAQFYAPASESAYHSPRGAQCYVPQTLRAERFILCFPKNCQQKLTDESRHCKKSYRLLVFHHPL